MYTEIVGLVLVGGLWLASVVGTVQLVCFTRFGVWPSGPLGWLVNQFVLLNKGGMMSNLNIAKMVCDREASHDMRTYKRDETGIVLARQCSRCGKIKWTRDA